MFCENECRQENIIGYYMIIFVYNIVKMYIVDLIINDIKPKSIHTHTDMNMGNEAAILQLGNGKKENNNDDDEKSMNKQSCVVV